MERATQTGPGPEPATSIQPIVEHAERTAAEVSELADSLLEYAGNVKREADQLVATLRDAAAKLAGTAATESEVQGEPTGSPGPSDGAQVLVAQMVVGGGSRDEMEKRLHDEFGIEDASGMLDAVLGPESDSD